MTTPEIILDQKLKEEMKKKNISQSSLSKSVGMRKTTLHNYLCGSLPTGLQNLI